MTVTARRYATIRNLFGGGPIVDAIDAAYRRIHGEPEQATATPQWDGDARTLRFQGTVLTQYRRNRAENQMAVLDAFEEDGWPCSIDAPFHESKIRETVRSLNIAIGRTAAIRFFADGTGERIGWEVR